MRTIEIYDTTRTVPQLSHEHWYKNRGGVSPPRGLPATWTPCPAADTDLRILDRPTKLAIQKPLFEGVTDGTRTRDPRYHKPML